ncbi:MAG: efflux RND transporter periplasmic adaptor subunit [Syntrophorhabdus sp.]
MVLIIVFHVGLALFLFAGCSKEKKAEAPPVVEVAEVVQKDVPIIAEWVATLDGMVNATIRAQVQGYLIKQDYTEGNIVKKGQVLFEIDPRTFQAILDQSRGELGRARARWDQTKANLARVKPLAAQNAVSRKDLDDAIASEQTARAAVQSAKAAVEKAALDLGFTKIKSPITGIAGMAKAQIGNLVGPGQIAELTTVSTVNPIKAYVSLGEQEYMKAVNAKKKQSGKVNLELILADGSTFPPKGEFAFADRQVDERTGTIRVATLFPNPDNLLRPGQFARIHARMGTKNNALLVPQRAVTEVQGRYLVAVVGPGNKIAIRQVTASDRYGQLWVIDEGLKPGEKVVAEGVQRVKEGMVVTPKPYLAQPEQKPGDKSPVKAEPGQAQGTPSQADSKPGPETGQSKPEAR